MYSSDDDSSSEGDEMPWQQMWLSSESELGLDALRRENNWWVCGSCGIFCSLAVMSEGDDNARWQVWILGVIFLIIISSTIIIIYQKHSFNDQPSQSNIVCQS